MTAPAAGSIAALEARLERPKHPGHPAIVAYLTAGYPSPSSFPDLLHEVAAVADAVEIGVPFTDPMADGVTIQRTSREALRQGVTLKGIFDQLASLDGLGAPVLLMSYLNPLLAFDLDRLVTRAAETGVTGFIVPDLPLEESETLGNLAHGAGLALVQLVSPVTPPSRRQRLCRASRGFVYAVTNTGVTGTAGNAVGIGAYLDSVRTDSSIPVCAGFGISTRDQVEYLAPHVDGVIVGSALLEVIERGGNAASFLRQLIGDS